MDRDSGFYALIAILVFSLIFFACGMMAGRSYQAITYLNQCVEKYGDMPANKVKQHCQEILEFKK